ncbi:J domain-containing protein [Mycena indigotica]|uniref:J domain-containing protein n=1 Tax=Mycena indigotica TaxID=2126181 RepID=A0A8H6S3X7_9AGAR|nr:J domain-containing protein [Mycena indigotica]KAF7291387.1 J domain-containing protein [Mycena indigotica]
MYRRGFSSSRRYRAAATHYEVLGLARDASPAQIKTAFFALSKRHHPDVPDHKSTPAFHEITAAYNVLRDPVSRRAYDNTLPSIPRPAPSTLYSRHMADTAARYRRAATRSSPPPQSHSHVNPHSSSHRAQPSQTSFRKRAAAHDPVLGARDRHERHPGQRYRPPDPVAQAAVWAVKKELMREQKTRPQRYVVGVVGSLGALFGISWVLGTWWP